VPPLVMLQNSILPDNFACAKLFESRLNHFLAFPMLHLQSKNEELFLSQKCRSFVRKSRDVVRIFYQWIRHENCFLQICGRGIFNQEMHGRPWMVLFQGLMHAQWMLDFLHTGAMSYEKLHCRECSRI